MGSVAVQGTGISAVAVYQCNRGYRLEGDSRRVCQASETWTGTVPTCKSEFFETTQGIIVNSLHNVKETSSSK